jgi:excinuclease UvrABC nuclease subunit
MNYDIFKYWIALKSIAGVGNITFPALVDKFGSLPAIFAAPVSKLSETREFPKISPQQSPVLRVGTKLK